MRILELNQNEVGFEGDFAEYVTEVLVDGGNILDINYKKFFEEGKPMSSISFLLDEAKTGYKYQFVELNEFEIDINDGDNFSEIATSLMNKAITDGGFNLIKVLTDRYTFNGKSYLSVMLLLQLKD